LRDKGVEADKVVELGAKIELFLFGSNPIGGKDKIRAKFITM
jgi:hypothetical protein